MVAKVTQDFQLGHQGFLLSEMGAGWREKDEKFSGFKKGEGSRKGTHHKVFQVASWPSVLSGLPRRLCLKLGLPHWFLILGTFTCKGYNNWEKNSL